MIFEAGTVEKMLASAQWINLFQYVEQCFCGHHGMVGAVVKRAVVDLFSGEENPRKLLVFNADPRIGLVVLEHDVVARLVLLDEVVLEQQGLRLRLHDDELDVGNTRHQHPGLACLFLVEIAGDATLQVLRLAHIDQGAVLIEVTVNPRFIGQNRQCLLNSQLSTLNSQLLTLNS